MLKLVDLCANLHLPIYTIYSLKSAQKIMTITSIGLRFGTIYVDELDEWFWNVWDNQPHELCSPPIFFGFSKTFKEVENNANEFFLKAIPGEEISFTDYDPAGSETFRVKQSNEYTRDFFENPHNTKLSPLLSKNKLGDFYFAVIWKSFLSFLKNKDPIFFNRKASQKEYKK